MTFFVLDKRAWFIGPACIHCQRAKEDYGPQCADGFHAKSLLAASTWQNRSFDTQVMSERQEWPDHAVVDVA